MGKIVNVTTVGGRSIVWVDDVRRTELSAFPLATEVPHRNCTASSTGNINNNGCDKTATNAGFFYFSRFVSSTLGQWVKIEFGSSWTLLRFSWLNRGFPRNIKDVTLSFDDGTTQAMQIPRRSVATTNVWADPYDRRDLSTHCQWGDRWESQVRDFSSCTSELSSVTTAWVKITVDSVWGGVKTWSAGGGTFTDFAEQGAYRIVFWGFNTASQTSLQESGGYKVCSVTEANEGEVKMGVGCAGRMANPPITFSGLGNNNLEEFPTDGATFQAVQGVEGARVMTSISAACTQHRDLNKHVRLASDPAGAYWKHDPSLVLLENTLTHPASINATSKQSCPAVPRNFLNKAHLSLPDPGL